MTVCANHKSRPAHNAGGRSIRFARKLAALLALSALMSCGGGDGNDSNPGGGSSDAQEGCYFRYAGSPPAEGQGPDPLLEQQWHLPMLDVLSAWSTAKGQGVRIAVIDDGIETLHEDLFPNVAAYRNYRRDVDPQAPPLPCDASETHGTQVAGIAAARDGNGVGVAGVAPRVSLAVYNAIAEAAGTEADVADALRRDEVVTGVYNNSWGAPDSTGMLRASGTLFRNAIADGTRRGRNGKGSIYVFPAGNGGCGPGASIHCVPDDSNYDGYVNAPGVIAACGIDATDKAPWNAEPGANILVCGISGNRDITTTAVRNRYTSRFEGTSASTPMVSGVAALMLQVAPSLTWRDVRLILATTARKTSDSGWETNIAEGAPLPVHPLYGFGVVDAARAVAVASTWASVGGSESLRSCSYTRTPSIAIRDGATVADRITVPDTCTIHAIEWVEVSFTARHASSGDLKIELVRSAPTAPVTTLARTRVCRSQDDYSDRQVVSCGDYSGWVFTSVRNLNERPQGNWTLQVTDASSGDEGTWDSWELTIRGR